MSSVVKRSIDAKTAEQAIAATAAKARVIGAIGVSGGHYTQDMECALAGLKAIGAPAA